MWPLRISAKEALGIVQNLIKRAPDATGIVRISIRGQLAGLLSKYQCRAEMNAFRLVNPPAASEPSGVRRGRNPSPEFDGEEHAT